MNRRTQTAQGVLTVKIYALDIPNDHLSLEVLSRFGETIRVESWPPQLTALDKEPAMIFARIDDAQELKRICTICEERGDWCFAWASDAALVAIANDVSPALVDFVSDRFDEQELVLRLVRLVRLERTSGGGNILGVPDEIADELTKKQLVILKALFEAGEVGLRKMDIAQRIWKQGTTQGAKASGFNVHVLHLRRKLERFGLMISYDKHDRVYRLRAAIRPKTTRRRATSSGPLQLNQ